MKKILLLLLVLPLTNSFTTSNSISEDIFSISQSTITTKQKFIDNFHNDAIEGAFIKKNSSSILSKNGLYHYSVNFQRYSDYSSDDPGDYECVEIKSNTTTICRVRNDNSWAKIKQSFKNHTNNDYCIPIHLSDTATALILTGFQYPSEPALLTIIIIEKECAKLVFNKEMYITDITKNDNSFSMLIQANIQEWDENNNPIDAPIINRIWSENGVLKFENM